MLEASDEAMLGVEEWCSLGNILHVSHPLRAPSLSLCHPLLYASSAAQVGGSLRGRKKMSRVGSKGLSERGSVCISPLATSGPNTPLTFGSGFGAGFGSLEI